MNNITSRIFWHFTGSPKNINWKNIISPNDILKFGSPKSNEESIEILKYIFDSQMLKATATEKILGKFQTNKFCCVTDIPINFLHVHRKYYGNVAIGFASKNIYNSFNPVLYLKKNIFIEKFLEFVKTSPIKIKLEDLGISKNDALNNNFEPNEDGTYSIPTEKPILDISKKGVSYLVDHVKFTKFSDIPEESFYQEKEWRSITTFHFDYSDIEALIVPKENINNLIEYLSSKHISNVSILSWEVIEKS
jgi:hypothetical protein